MTRRLRWQWFWNLPNWVHVLVKKRTGWVLRAEYDDETFEPLKFVWDRAINHPSIPILKKED